MNQHLALRVLSTIMGWTDHRARQEFGWLKLMARLKYDGYRDFHAGMRFTESLVTWLQQFERDERETAYAFVRRNLVYIGPSEMERLVQQFYPSTVTDHLLRTAATKHNIPLHRVLADVAARETTERLRSQTLFMGLSDGARMDKVRHANSDILDNEQIVHATQVDKEKWRDLLANLRKRLKDASARFRLVYLVDDFTATGTSLLRYDEGKKEWKGKLRRFNKSVRMANSELDGDRVFEDNWKLCIHHYVASADAVTRIRRQLRCVTDAFPEDFAGLPRTSFGIVLPSDLPIDKVPGRYDDFLQLTQTYYDPEIETKHTAIGGVDHQGLGYGGCALPVVLEHNTPNNSVALLWAETKGTDVNGMRHHAMRPLFRRRQRHTSR